MGSAGNLSHGQQSSRKRARYVLHACERCKRQKIRCNGEQPCDKCKVKRPKECSYGQWRHINWDPLQSHLDTDAGNNSLKDGGENIANSDGSLSAWNIESFRHLESLLQSQSAKLDLLLERSGRSQDGDGLQTTNAGETHIDQAEPAFNLIKPAQADGGRHNESAVGSDENADAQVRSPTAPLPLYCGPSSSSFCISIVGVTLNKTYGTTTREQVILEPATVSILNGDIVIDHDERPEEDPPEPSLHTPLIPVPVDRHDESLRLLQELNQERALDMICAYDDLVGAMHPVLLKDDLLRKTTKLYTLMGVPTTRGVSNIQLDQADVSIVKMVLATVLVMEGPQNHEMASKLFKSIQRDVEAKIWTTATEVRDLHLLILVAIYHFVKGSWRLAWRVTNNLVRMALELGLNLKKVVVRTFEDSAKRINVVNTFWTIFVLDRQMSYALGLPKSLEDADVDNGLPLPYSEPYLNAMVEYCHLGSKACDSLSEALCGQPRGTAEWQESFEYFRYRLDQWQRMHIDGDIQAAGDISGSRRIRHPRTVLYLRANQLRLLMLRPVLCGFNNNLSADGQHWDTAVGIACDTVQVVADLESTSDLYQAHQTQYNYFLVTALGVLLLLGLAQDPQSSSPSNISNNAQVGPATHDKARKAAITTLGLLRSTMNHSPASKRLWLRAYSMCLRLGVISDDQMDLSAGMVSEFGPPKATNGVVDFSNMVFSEFGSGLEEIQVSFTPDFGWLLPEFEAI
ncbi:uncharacterized protein PV07_05339 [Cladophialophora immunda]|uniref:Zn(2)-C6 fungal-type domain-containing protein n=1 Tax=Cladophialophora immunda TaxID=569365 RepID=A0A0D1ZNN1_9EURO|nr:uncharacterized protein PV07_05339 [Cladophialophora immunda]KIW29526.1 hypothetical protein PV07_05339 [Cladophialophora immunda]